MKKSKLLIPALTVASVGAVVAPLMTLSSCSQDVVVASSTDLDYKGEQHAAVSGGLSLSKATDEYLKDTKYFAQDTLGVIMSLLGFMKSSMTEERGYKNVKIENVAASVSNVSLSAKEAKVVSDDIYNKNAIKGALASGKLNVKYTLSYDEVDIEENTNASLIKNTHDVEDMTMTLSFTDCFLFLGRECGLDIESEEYKVTESRFTFNLYGCKNASENWQLNAQTGGTQTQTITTTSGDTYVQTSNNSESMVLSAKMSDDISVFGLGSKQFYGISITESNYLSKLDWDGTDPIYMAIDSLEAQQPRYQSNYTTLTNGKDYTFVCDVESKYNIKNFGIYDSEGVLPITVKSCTLNGTNVTYTQAEGTSLAFDSELTNGTFKITFTMGGTKKDTVWALLYPDAA